MVKEQTFFNYDVSKRIYFGFFLSVLLLAFLMFFINKLSGVAILMLLPVLLVLAVNVNKYYIYYLVTTLFIDLAVPGPVSIPLINVVALSIFVVFILNNNTALFNKFKLPVMLKLASAIFIFAVFLSTINSAFRNIQSYYFFFLFLTYIFTGYIVFRSVKDSSFFEKFINYFFICVLITSISIIIQIVITSKVRSVAIVGYSIMDFTAITLTILILRNFIMGNANLKIILISLFTLTVFITSQSRFAWMGFAISLTYGLILIYKYDDSGKQFLLKRMHLMILCVLIFLGIAVSLGVHNFVLSRFSDVSLDFFERSDEGEFVNNSLESRALIWFTAYNAFQANPVTGVGYQMFYVISENYNVLPEYLFETYVEGLDPHNTMLAFLTETGIIGFFAFLFFVFSAYYYSFKSIKISLNRLDRINSIILNVVIFFIISNSFYSGQYTMKTQAFFMYIFLGLGIGNYVYIKNKSVKAEMIKENGYI